MRTLCGLLLITLTSSSAFAQTSYPMLMSLSPVAAEQGQTSEHTLDARYSMFGAYQVFVTGQGVTGEIATPMELDKDGKEPSLTKIQIRFKVEPDAQPGVRDFRIVGPTGPSTLGQLVIVPDVVVNEDPKNDTAETAQQIPVPSAVCGRVEKAEDVDFYRFHLDQPAKLTFHCRAMRLQDRIHDLQTHIDPIITIRNAKTGSTLAAADNTYAADPFLAQEFPPGDYLLEVRDVRYAGNAYWNYCIEISDRPYVSHVYPSAVTKGQSTDLQLIGQHLPTSAVAAFAAPESLDPCTVEVGLAMESHTSNPVPVVVSELPVILEEAQDNNTPETAQLVPFPGIISGRMETEADIDCYRFEARKGDRMTFEVKARRNWSELDSNLRLLNSDGKQLAENDDMRLYGKMTVQDSQIENWTAPADGIYTLEIRDVHLRGSAASVYALELRPARPHFELILDSDKTWLTPGSSAAIFVRVVRVNGFDGEVQLHIDGLPPGVTAECGRILAGKGVDGCIILTAAPDAKLAAANIQIRGTSPLAAPPTAEAVAATSAANTDAAEAASEDKAAMVEPQVLSAIAVPMQETYMPGGGRSHWPVDMHTVAIGSPADVLHVKLSTHEVTLKPGESVTVDVEVVRNTGFDKNVTLDVLYQHLSSKFANTLPEGVTIDSKKSQTLLTGTNSKGAITLTAAANAPAVDRQLCSVMANVSINFVMKATYSSEPLLISVAAE